MSNDELILEIIEKVHAQGQETSRKVNEIQMEQTRQGVIIAQNTNDVAEHMKRTAILEKRVAFYDSIAMIVAALAGIVVFLIKLVPHIIQMFHR